MQVHIPTMFLVIIAASATLAAAISVVAYRRNHELLLWAGGLVLHALAYALYGLRGQISDLASIVVANAALSSAFALFSEGLFRFQRRPAPRWLIWSPVGAIAVAFYFLLDDARLRVILSGLVFGFQALILLQALLQKRRQTAGRGQYILATGIALTMAVLLVRVGGTLAGKMEMLVVTASNPIQAATFLTAVVSLMLLALGLVMMTQERAEEASHQGRLFIRSVLDSVSSQIAVLDGAGVIVETNEAWRRFATDNSDRPGQSARHTGIGTDYLVACQVDSAAPDPEATAAIEGIRAVLDGRLPSFRIEYPCHAPAEPHWFTMTVTPLGAGGQGAVVVHTDITDRKLAEERIHNLAYHDALTGLPNRRLLDDRLIQALAASRRSGLHGAVMLLDLDNFKPLNDVHGHAVGDLLLAEVGRRLAACVREVDTVARLGGDEFVVVLGGLDADQEVSRQQALAVAEKIRAALAQPYVLRLAQAGLPEAVIEHHCTASIGVVPYTGREPSPHEILRRADQAMYLAKEDGRNAIHLHE